MEKGLGEAVALPTKKVGLLFARLACADSEGLTRDQLAALFWPDRAEKQARGSLRQALLGLRRAFQPAAVLSSQGNRISLAKDAIRLEVHELERAVRGDQLEALPELYRGPLLADAEPIDSSFDGWLDAERTRLHRLALDAFRRLLERQRASASTRAEETALRLAALDPTSEDAYRALAEMLAERGDRSGALRVLDGLRDRLLSDLDAEPELETAALAVRLRRGLGQGLLQPKREASISLKVEAARSDRAAPPRDLRERRHAVIVHVVGDLGRDDDPEARHDRHRTLVERAERAAEVGRGFAGSVGPGVVRLSFGVPHAYGDESRRALASVARLLDERLLLRIGVSAGDVVVDGADPAGAIIGRPVERAERISAEAPPNGALADAALIAESSAHFEVEGEAVEGDLVLVRALRPQIRLTPFTGRRAELSQLSAILDVTVREGVGRVICVRGEAGIGKTRLVRQLGQAAVDQGFACHAAYVLDFGGPSRRDALRSLVRALAGLGETDAEDEADAAVGPLLAATSGPEGEVFLRDLLDAPLSTEQRGLLDAMKPETRGDGLRQTAAAAVRLAGQLAHQLLVVEDLHWAEADTVAALAELCQVVLDAPVVLIVTTRIEGDPLDASFRGRVYGALLGRAGVRRITDDLAGAHQDADAAEVAALRAGLEAEVAQACFLRGNLLFPTGDVEGCLREHERSLSIARSCHRADLEAVALGGLGDAQYLAGRMRSATDSAAWRGRGPKRRRRVQVFTGPRSMDTSRSSREIKRRASRPSSGGGRSFGAARSGIARSAFTLSRPGSRSILATRPPPAPRSTPSAPSPRASPWA